MDIGEKDGGNGEKKNINQDIREAMTAKRVSPGLGERVEAAQKNSQEDKENEEGTGGPEMRLVEFKNLPDGRSSVRNFRKESIVLGPTRLGEVERTV